MTAIPEPIFNVKKNADIFKLYGSGKIVEDASSKDGSDADCISDDLQSMRIRLAVMKAKEQCEEENEARTIRKEAIDEVDANLREIIALESPFPTENRTEKSISPRTKSPEKKRKAHDDASKADNTTKEGKDKITSQVESQLIGIGETYTKIFQALIVLINEHHLNDEMVLSTIEMDKTNKRSREFEVRLHRLIFEAKQKTLVLKGAMVKNKLHDTNKTRNEANKALYQSLRCYSSIMSAYLNHLPLSGRQLFPSALQALFQQLSSVGYLANDLKFKNSNQIISDTHRLSAVYNQFQPKFHKTDEELTSKSPASKMFGSEKNMKIINNLAKQKFGAPPPALNLSSLRSPRRRTNSKRDAMMKSGSAVATPRTFSGLRAKQKEIIPKPTKLLKDRVKHSKQKIYGDEEGKDYASKQENIRASFDDIVLKNGKEDETDHQNNGIRKLSRISVSTHSHADLDENILSLHSPRPPPSVVNNAGSQNVCSSRDVSPPKTNLSSVRRQTSIRQNSVIKEPEVRKLSRQSTISPLKDEDYFTDIGNQSIKSKKEQSFEVNDLEEVEEEKENSKIRKQIRSAGFGNVLAFASDDKLQALNRFGSFNNDPVINENVIQGSYLQRGGKRYLEISKEELNDILSHKEQFEHDQAKSHFTRQIISSKFRFQNENPFQLIQSISDKVTNEIIENVCHEMVTSDIVNDLIQKELQN